MRLAISRGLARNGLATATRRSSRSRRAAPASGVQARWAARRRVRLCAIAADSQSCSSDRRSGERSRWEKTGRGSDYTGWHSSAPQPRHSSRGTGPARHAPRQSSSCGSTSMPQRTLRGAWSVNPSAPGAEKSLQRLHGAGLHEDVRAFKSGAAGHPRGDCQKLRTPANSAANSSPWTWAPARKRSMAVRRAPSARKIASRE